MTVLIGYLPTPEGDAAFAAGLREAALRQESVVVVNSPRDGALVSAEAAAPDQVAGLITRAEAAGVPLDAAQARTHDLDRRARAPASEGDSHERTTGDPLDDRSGRPGPGATR